MNTVHSLSKRSASNGLLVLLALGSLLLAPRSVAQTGAVTKSTASATRNDLVEDLNIGTGRTATVKAGGTLDASAGTLTLASNQIGWAKVSKTGSSLADLATRSFADLQSKPTTLTGYGITDGITAAAVAAAYQPLDADLTSIAGNTTAGFLTRTAANTYTARTLTGTTGQITVTNGDGVAGAPTISLPSTITQATTFSAGLTVTATSPGIVFNDTTSTSNSRNWGWYGSYATEGDIKLRVGSAKDIAPDTDYLTLNTFGATPAWTFNLGTVAISNNTTSTSTTTGSATFGGGIGVAGAVYSGGSLNLGAAGAATNFLGLNRTVSGTILNSGIRAYNFYNNGTSLSIESYSGAGALAGGVSLDATQFRVNDSAGGNRFSVVYATGATTAAGDITFGTSASVLNGATGSIGLTATGTNQSVSVTPTGTGFFVVGSSTEKMGLNGGSLSFNRAISTGGIYDSTGYGYQFQHTKSTTAASDLLALGVYTPAGSTVTNSALVINGSGNVLVGTATDSSNGRLQFATHTTSAGGIGLGTDWSFHRASSSVARLTSSAANASELNILSTNGYDASLTLSTSGGVGGIKMKAGTNTVAIQPNGGAPTVDFGSVNGVVSVNSTTASTSTTTGALTVGGGLGVAGAGYFGGALNVAPAAGGTVATFGATANNNSIAVTRTGGATIALQTSAFDGYLNSSATLQLYSNSAAAVIIGAGGGSNTQAAFQSTTEATTGGAGSLTTAGGIYAAKKIISAGAIANLVGGTATHTAESTVNGATVEFIAKGLNSVGVARQAATGLNRFADDVWSLHDGTTERLRVGITTGDVRAGGSISPSNSAVRWSAGAGSPEGVVTAPVGSLYSRTDGGAGTSLYVKESGTGNTGWVAK